jgi:hypothetical protein
LPDGLEAIELAVASELDVQLDLTPSRDVA